MLDWRASTLGWLYSNKVESLREQCRRWKRDQRFCDYYYYYYYDYHHHHHHYYHNHIFVIIMPCALCQNFELVQDVKESLRRDLSNAFELREDEVSLNLEVMHLTNNQLPDFAACYRQRMRFDTLIFHTCVTKSNFAGSEMYVVKGKVVTMLTCREGHAGKVNRLTKRVSVAASERLSYGCCADRTIEWL